MKPFTFALIVSLVGVACVGPIEAGHYPHGFILGRHMHYWSPKVARVLFGPSAPIPTTPHPEPYVWPQFHTGAVDLRPLPVLYSADDQPVYPVVITR